MAILTLSKKLGKEYLHLRMSCNPDTTMDTSPKLGLAEAPHFQLHELESNNRNRPVVVEFHKDRVKLSVLS